MSNNTFSIKCQKCDKPVQNDFSFCPYCGSKIEFPQDIKKDLEANQISFGSIPLMLLPVERPLNEQEATIFSHFFSTIGTCSQAQQGALSCHFENHSAAWGSVDDWTGYYGDTCIALIYKITDVTALAAVKQLPPSSNDGSHYSSVISLIKQSASCFEVRKHQIHEEIEVPEALRGIVHRNTIRGDEPITHLFLAKDPLGFTGTYAISLADCYEEDIRDTYSRTYK